MFECNVFDGIWPVAMIHTGSGEYASICIHQDPVEPFRDAIFLWVVAECGVRFSAFQACGLLQCRQNDLFSIL